MRLSFHIAAAVATLSALLASCTNAVPVSELVEDREKLREFAKRYTSPTPIYKANQTLDDMQKFLMILNVQANPDPDVIKEVVAFDATYVSLAEDNPDLHKILPWAGTRARVGPQAFIDTFTRVGLWWTRGPFNLQAIFTDGQGNLTAWGNFEITSNTMKKTLSSPWSCRAEMNSEGKISYFQYMEDTFATTATFWAEGPSSFVLTPLADACGSELEDGYLT
ncbi:hypothetical protein B0T17DRAFT_501938 [Bombardia bombarda]|uniref:SnoaL-like domain-containing protein n=1 Tax=Bombardia bombarda TaxID=252184 RepID=A0AA39XIG4_9PEZI|nr:hypothetical protein B0T17DRAFT_501938 [Bombardia bombarda]